MKSKVVKNKSTYSIKLYLSRVDDPRCATKALLSEFSKYSKALIFTKALIF